MASTQFTDGVTLTAAAWFNDVDTSVYSHLTSVAGTNTVTATGPASQTAYAAGQMFRFIPANTNTGATTLNISSLGAKNIFIRGVACVGGEIVANVPVEVVYDGTQFNLMQFLPNGEYRSVQVFTANGTYTATAGLKRAKITVLGGGGAGGGSDATGAAQGSAGAGGAAGGIAIKTVSAATIGASQTVTIGAGGTGVSAASGNNGGTSSFGAIVSATGGSGGAKAGVANAAGVSGPAGGVGSSGDINGNGASGGPAFFSNAGGNFFNVAGKGADSPYGGGGVPVVQGTSGGGVGVGFASGGGGAATASGGVAQTGGAGAPGIVIVEEFF